MERLAGFGPLPRVVRPDPAGFSDRFPDVRARLVDPPSHAGPVPTWRASPEGFRLEIGPDGTTVAATDNRGVRHARQLVQRLSVGGPLPAAIIEDWPELPRRGIIEGFYGPVWSWDDRADMIDFAAEVRLNDYLYAPKDDPFHRINWRVAYPATEMESLDALARRADGHGIRFAVGVSTGLDMRYADEAEHDILRSKARQLSSGGVQHFVLLFDDISGGLTHRADVDRFGTGPAGLARAHAFTCVRFADTVATGSPLAMVPTDYSSNADSPYRSALRAALPKGIDVYWTGPETVTGSISAEDLRAGARTFDRPIQLWDNFPVNDFAPERLFLGPLVGRTGTVDPRDVSGAAANPMLTAAPSQIPLATFAEWAWNPAAYEPEPAWHRARRSIAGPDADGLAFLFEAAGSWPPEAQRDPPLAALIDRAVRDAAARPALIAELGPWSAAADLAEGGRSSLVEQLRPWLTAAAAEAQAVLAAMAAAEGRGSRSAARTAITTARGQFADVCRDLLLGAAEQLLVD